MLYNTDKRINKKWTLPDLLMISKKHQTRSSFKKHHQAAYYSTLKQKLEPKVFAHMICGNKLKAYNLDELLKIAKKFKTREMFKLNERGAYDAARRMGKLASVCKHMPLFATQDRYEEHVIHPKVKRFLNKNNISFKHEYSINKKARPDFIIFNKKNEVLIVEIKADNKIHEKYALTEQVNRYKKYGKILFKNKFKGVILASENGTYGLNLKTLEQNILSFIKK